MSRYIIKRYSREHWHYSASKYVIFRRFKSWLTAAVLTTTSEYMVKNHLSGQSFCGYGRNSNHARWLADDIMHKETEKRRESGSREAKFND